MKRENIFIAVCVFLTSLLLSGYVFAAGKNGVTKHTQKLLEALSQETGVNVGNLEVLNESVFSLPNIDGKYPTAKIRDKKTGVIHGITIDESGKKVDEEALLAEDLKKHKSTYGKLEPDLYEKVQTLQEDDPVRVAIWLTAPDEPLERPTVEDYKNKGEYLVEMEMQSRIKAKKTKLHNQQSPVVKHLNAIDAVGVTPDEFAPVIYAVIKKKHVHVLDQRDDVGGIFLDKEATPMLNVSVPSIGGTTVWSWGYTGLSQKVGVIEMEGIVPGNPYLNQVNRLGQCFGTSSPRYHATEVAGVIDSRHPSYTGIAYNSSLLGGEACSMSYSALNYATGWAHGSGAQLFNASWGLTTTGRGDSESQYQDYYSRTWGATFVDAAGNCNDYPKCYVISPALAFDTIAVGGYWPDNTMYGMSSWQNPVSAYGDREKPEIVAPVAVHTTYGNSSGTEPWITYEWGTSISTPHVTGAVALLTGLNSTLKYWPTAVKAILMATATGNFDSCSSVQLYACDSVDGAGRVAVDAAAMVASDSSKWTAGTVTSSSFDSYGDRYYSFYAIAGQTVRAAIAWDTSTSYAYYSSRPGADLDLYIYTPSGADATPGTFSGSFDNDFESLEFTAPETGYYTVDVYKNRFNISSVHLAVAWYNH